MKYKVLFLKYLFTTRRRRRNVLYEDVIWKGLKIILGRERAGIINYWYLDDRGEREGIKTLDNRELEEGVK